MAEQTLTAGDVKLTKLQLESPKKSLNLTGVFAEVSVFEDIFSNTMSGTITIFDTKGIIDFMPLMGEETLTITFQTPNRPEITQSFWVYKLDIS